jgi:hypothetical protein
MNIRYLIAPTPANETSVWLAFTITNDTISGYYQRMHNPKLSEFSSQLDMCLDKTVDDTKYRFRYVHHNDPVHPKLHSRNLNETGVDHIHLGYTHSVDTQLVRDFLNSLKYCESNLSHPRNTTFLTQAVCDDIIKTCENYTKNKAPSSFLVSSNDPDYLALHQAKHVMPSIYEHEACLKNQNLPCNSQNTKTPERYRDSYLQGEINGPVQPAIVDPVTLALNASAIFAITIGLFGLKRFQQAKQETAKINSVAEPTKTNTLK